MIARQFGTTDEAAALFGVKPNTLRVSLSANGHYMGIVPTKLPNRFLRWPLDQIRQLLAGGEDHD